jgi:putative membrane protein
MMGWYGGGMGTGMWLFMGLFWLALVVLIVWLLVQVLSPGSRRPQGGHDSAEEILDRRFARGEIDEPTYAAARAVLASTRGPRR